MELESKTLSILFLGISLVLFPLGVHRLKAPLNAWLIMYPYDGGNAYAPIPVGLGTLIWSLAAAPFMAEPKRVPLFLLGGAVIFLGLLIAPRILKPAWLQELEQHHTNIMPLLRKEIEAMGHRKWNKRIKTQEDLEEWVGERYDWQSDKRHDF